eukprot:824534-Rhodomonas_salina.1
MEELSERLAALFLSFDAADPRTRLAPSYTAVPGTELRMGYAMLVLSSPYVLRDARTELAVCATLCSYQTASPSRSSALASAAS